MQVAQASVRVLKTAIRSGASDAGPGRVSVVFTAMDLTDLNWREFDAGGCKDGIVLGV